MQSIGLLNRKFNDQTLELERSLPLDLNLGISLISKFLFSLKFIVSGFFPQNEIAQLFIGSPFNRLPDKAKNFWVACGITSCFWAVFIHFAAYFNARNNHQLYKFWMKLTFELPVKNERDYRVAGLSRRKTKEFWSNESDFNRVWNRTVNCYIVITSLVFCSQLFSVRLDGFPDLNGFKTI